MTKGQESLENIKREAGTPYFSTLYDIDMWREDFATVEKELQKPQQLYDLIKQKRDSAKEYVENDHGRLGLIPYQRILGNIATYNDIISLMESMFEGVENEIK